MLDNTLATYIKTIESYCNNSEEITEKTCDFYERLLSLQRSTNQNSKLTSQKRKAKIFMEEIIELGKTKTEFKFRANLKSLDEAYWISMIGLTRNIDNQSLSLKDRKHIEDIEQNIKISSIRSKCLMYWIINSITCDWMDNVKQWFKENNIFVCDVPHSLILRDLRISEDTWKSFWYNLKFDADFFQRFINQKIEQGIKVNGETRKEIEYVKKLRP